MNFKARLEAFVAAARRSTNESDAPAVMEIDQSYTKVTVSQFDSIPSVQISALNGYYNAKDLRRIAKTFKALADAIDSLG